MPDIGSVTAPAYLSDGEIIAWLEQKSDEQYGRLHTMMDGSTQRGQLIEDLTKLKADIDANMPIGGVEDEIEAIRAKYKGTPFEGEVESTLGPMEARLKNATGEGNPEIAQDLAIINDTTGTYTLEQKAAAQDDYDAASANLLTRDDQNPFKDEFVTKLDAETGQLGRIDQLALIQIQDLVGTVRQNDQLASNLIASGDQACTTILSNYRG
jgi:predicted AAA+ superfamily ATPase